MDDDKKKDLKIEDDPKEIDSQRLKADEEKRRKLKISPNTPVIKYQVV